MILEGPVNSWMVHSSNAGMHACDFIPFETISKWFIMKGGLDATPPPLRALSHMLALLSFAGYGVNSGMNLTFHLKYWKTEKTQMFELEKSPNHYFTGGFKHNIKMCLIKTRGQNKRRHTKGSTCGTALLPNIPLRMARQRPTITSSLMFSIMPAASPAIRASRIGAKRKSHNSLFRPKYGWGFLVCF